MPSHTSVRGPVPPLHVALERTIVHVRGNMTALTLGLVSAALGQ
jgi:hypothetical protein